MSKIFGEVTVKAIMQDWIAGKSHGELKKIYELTDAQEYAITWATDRGYTAAQITQSLPSVNSNMKAAVKEKVMSF